MSPDKIKIIIQRLDLLIKKYEQISVQYLNICKKIQIAKEYIEKQNLKNNPEILKKIEYLNKVNDFLIFLEENPSLKDFLTTFPDAKIIKIKPKSK